MGFFSIDCKGCGHSLRCVNGCTSESSWMIEVVLQDVEGVVASGQYDGYGRVYDDTDGEFDTQGGIDNYEGWHKRCYVLAGKPNFTGVSRYAFDQGYFIEADSDPLVPTSKSEMAALLVKSDLIRKEVSERRAAAHAAYLASKDA